MVIVTTPKGQRFVVGSEAYFNYAIPRIRRNKRTGEDQTRVYNPITGGLVKVSSDTYEKYQLDEVYARAEDAGFKRRVTSRPEFTREQKQGLCAKPRIVLSDNCMYINLHYYNGQYRRFRTLKFLRYLRDHNLTYHCYTFDSSFFQRIADCLQSGVTTPVDIMRRHLSGEGYQLPRAPVSTELAVVEYQPYRSVVTSETSDSGVKADVIPDPREEARNILKEVGVCNRKTYRRYSLMCHPDRLASASDELKARCSQIDIGDVNKAVTELDIGHDDIVGCVNKW